MIKWAWDAFKPHWQMAVGVTAVFFLMQMGIGMVAGLFPAKPEQGALLWLVGTIVTFVLSSLSSIGMLSFALRMHDAPEEVLVGDLWNPSPLWRYIGASLFSGVIVMVGFVLLVVPGIIAMLMLMFATLLVIDRTLSPVAALKESARITTGYRWQLLWLVILVALLNLLGALAFMVGLLITVPVSYLAVTHAYRTLATRADAVAQVERA